MSNRLSLLRFDAASGPVRLDEQRVPPLHARAPRGCPAPRGGSRRTG